MRSLITSKIILTILTNFYLTIFISTFVSAGLFGLDEPKEGDLKDNFKMELPGYLQLSDFDAEVLENLGSKVEPKWGSRFEAIVKPNVNLYVFDRKDKNDVTFVVLKTEQGKKTYIYGKYVSIPYQGQWKHMIDIDGNPLKNLGNPIEQFGGQVIIKGSVDEQNYYTDLKEKERAFWATVNEDSIKRNIKEYYETRGEWAGKYLVESVRAIRFEKISDNRIQAHARYIWKSPDGKETGQDDRYFDLNLNNGRWEISRMGGHMSGKL